MPLAEPDRTKAAAPSARYPWGAIEVARWVVSLGCLVAAVWLFVATPSALLKVAVEDFAERWNNTPASSAASRLPLAEFIARQTEGRVIAVEGPEWTDFVEQVQYALNGLPSDFTDHRGKRFADYLYFQPWQAPLKEIAGRLNDEKPFYWLALKQGPERTYLAVTYSPPADSSAGGAPTWLLHPARHLSIYFLVPGVLVFLLLRRRRVGGPLSPETEKQEKPATTQKRSALVGWLVAVILLVVAGGIAWLLWPREEAPPPSHAGALSNLSAVPEELLPAAETKARIDAVEKRLAKARKALRAATNPAEIAAAEDRVREAGRTLEVLKRQYDQFTHHAARAASQTAPASRPAQSQPAG